MTSYGTVNNDNSPSSQQQSHDSANDMTSLLPSKQESSRFNLRSHLTRPVTRDWADLVLLFGYIITGLLDSTATAVWGSFVSMQTGNTVYLGLGLARPTESGRWVKAGTSIVGFCFGSFCFSRFHRAFAGSPRKRWVMLASVFAQLVCIVVAAAIVTFAGEPRAQGYDASLMEAQGKGEGLADLKWTEIVPLFIIAFHSAGQAVISRAVQFGSYTSVVLTSIYLDLFSDQKLFSGFTESPDRNRRMVAPLLLLVGALVGGFWSHSEFGMKGALWTAAVLKVVTLMTWTCWKSEKEEET